MRSSVKKAQGANAKAAVKAAPKARPKTASKAPPKAVSKARPKAESKTVAPPVIVREEGSAVPPAASKELKAAKAEPAAKAPKEKVKKPKLVRDSFAMPEAEYEVLRDLKKSCMKAGIDIKKSELLRVGVALLKKQAPEEIQAALADLVPLKAGRPRKESESTGQTKAS